MQLRVGSYSCQANSVRIARSISTLLSDSNQPYGERHRWNVTGQLVGSGQADLIAQMAALRLALGQQYQDLSFHADDGSIAFHMPNSTSLDGVKILDYSEPGASPAEFATLVDFAFIAEASYIYGFGLASGGSVGGGAGEAFVLAFEESLIVSGGGARYGFTEVVNGPPVKSLLAVASVCRATQQGLAEGLGAYPRPAGPIWPQHLAEDPVIQYRSPERTGQGLARYRVEWTYTYASPVRLDGQPTIPA